MGRKFKVGDIVTLGVKNAPDMVILGSLDAIYSCAWFNNNGDLQIKDFHEGVLKEAKGIRAY